MQQDLVGVTGVGGGHRLGRTMVGFVGGCDAGKRLHDVRQVLA